VLAGAAVGGGIGGLCTGALLWTGQGPPMRGKNSTARRFRGPRRRLVIVSVASATLSAYLCTLPTPSEGGTGAVAMASEGARRIGCAMAAAARSLQEPAPSRGLRVISSVSV